MTHDQNFKNIIFDYPKQALEFFAAEEVPNLDDQLEILPVRQEPRAVQIVHRMCRGTRRIIHG